MECELINFKSQWNWLLSYGFKKKVTKSIQIKLYGVKNDEPKNGGRELNFQWLSQWSDRHGLGMVE